MIAAFHHTRYQHYCNLNYDHLHPLRHECVRSRVKHHDVQLLGGLDEASLVGEVMVANHVDPLRSQFQVARMTCAYDGVSMSIVDHVDHEDYRTDYTEKTLVIREVMDLELPQMLAMRQVSLREGLNDDNFHEVMVSLMEYLKKVG